MVFLKSTFNIYFFILLFYLCSCRGGNQNKDRPVSINNSIRSDSISSVDVENKNFSSVGKDTVSFWVYNEKRSIPLHNRAFNQDSVSPEMAIELINRVNGAGYVELKLSKISNDTIFVTIADATYLTQQMGTTGAAEFMSVVTFTLTELKGIRYVSFDFTEGDHAVPGTYSRLFYENRSLANTNEEFSVGLDPSNTVTPRLDTISELIFKRSVINLRHPGFRRGEAYSDSIISYLLRIYAEKSKVADSIAYVFRKKFPDRIIQNDSALILRCIDSTIHITLDTSQEAGNSFSGIEYFDYKKNYLIIRNAGWEYEVFYLYNPVTEYYCVMDMEPEFINDSLVYCYGSDYGSGIFQLCSPGRPKIYYRLDSGFSINECYISGKIFYLSLFSEIFRDVKKYIRIDFSKVL